MGVGVGGMVTCMSWEEVTVPRASFACVVPCPMSFTTGSGRFASRHPSHPRTTDTCSPRHPTLYPPRARDAETKLEAIECELETLKDIAGGGGDQKDLLNRLIAKVGQLEAAAAENEARRRALQNEVLQLKGNVRVFCRVRPGKAGPTAVQCLPDRASVAVAQGGKDHAFSFDRVFPPTAGQAEVFAEVAELVQSALDGYQVCLFSYGQTGAGKTHTMQGQPGSPSARGVIPRAVDLILDSAARMERQGWRFAFEAAFVEIYNEQIR